MTLPMDTLWHPDATRQPLPDDMGGILAGSRGLVLHVQAGNNNPHGWFARADVQASSHWWVAKSGGLFQYVPADRVAWAQAGGNAGWHSVETEGVPSEPLTAAQVATLGRLYAWGHARWAWPLQLADTPAGTGLGWHGMGGAAWGGHTGCPGELRKAQRPAILAAAQPVARPATPPPNESEDDMPSPTEWTKEERAVVGAAVADYLATQMRQLVTTDPDTGGQVRMEDVKGIPNVGLAVGLLLLRSSFGMTRDKATRDEVARIGDHLGADGPLVAWTRSIGTDLAAVRADLTRITAGAGGAVDLGAVFARLDALDARLAGLTLTVTPTP